MNVDKIIADVRKDIGERKPAVDANGHAVLVKGTGKSKAADVPWYRKAAKWIDEHTSEDADVTFNYGSLTNGNQTLTQTIDKYAEKNRKTLAENNAAANALRSQGTADTGGTTFGKGTKKVTADMNWWQRLGAYAANEADTAFGTYSPGNALGRSEVENTVASGLQDTGSSLAETLGFLTDQKKDRELTEADRAFGYVHADGTVSEPVETPQFIKDFWQKVSDKAYKHSDKMAKESAESRVMAKEGAGTAGSLLVDAGSAATQMAGDIALGAATGSGLAPLAVRAFGGGLKEARESGASRQRQFNYALSSAAVEVLTEKIGSIALPLKGAYGKGAVDDIVRDFVNGAAKTPLGRAGLNTLFSALSEGGEEIVSDIVNPIIKTATFDREGYKEYGSPEYWSEMLRDGIIGAGLGLVGNGGQVVRAVNETRTNAKASKSGGAETAEDTAATSTAEEVAPQQTAQDGARRRSASQVIADMVTAENGTRNDTAGQDESTVVNTDPSEHTAVEQRVIDEYQAAVDEGLTKFVSDVASKRITKQNARYELKPVSDRAAKDIKRITGVDVSGNKTVIETRQVAHILKDHGENGLTDQTMRDVNDIGRIQWVIDNYDSSKDGGATEAYVTVKQNGKHGTAKTVVFEKAVNGTYYVVEAVPDTAKKTNFIVSAYMSKNGAKKTAPSSVTGKSPRDTPQHAARVAVSDTISQEAADVNPRNEQISTSALEAEQSNLPKGTGAAELGFTENRELNTSRYRSNTIERSYDPESVADYGMEADNPYFQYEVKHEGTTQSRAQSLFDQLTQEDGISAVTEWLLEKQEWTAEDADLAEIATREITRQLEDGLNDPNMSISEYNELAETRALIAHAKSAHMTNAGQVIQSLAKWTRESEDSGAAAGDTALSAIIENENLSEQERYDAVRQVVRWQALLEGSNPNTEQGRSDLTRTIMEIGEQRGVLNWATIRSKRAEITRSMVEKSLNALSGEDLQALAYNSLAQVGNDQVYSADVGKMMKCIQMLAMLSNPKTKLVNVSGNSVFSVIDTVAMNGSALADQIMSCMTGTRSVAADKGIFDAEGWKAARTALNRTIAEIALDVDMGADSRYQNTGYTFKANGNIFDRVLHVLERNQKYGMVLPDEIAKGFASGRHKAAMERLIAEGKVVDADADYAENYADKIAKYRTFQNDSWLATMLGGVHDGLNVIGVGDSGKRIKGREKDYKVGSFGVGDIVAPFTRVAGNLVSTAVDYTPIGFARGFAEACSVVYNAKRSGKPNHSRQAQAVQHMGRGATGTAVIALFAAISAAGLLRRADDENDPDIAALNAAEGIAGTQLNISALSRALAGESTEWRNGDELLDLSRFEPVNSIMALGTIVSTWDEDTTFGDKASASFNALLESAAELPVIQNIQTLAVDTIKYKQDFGEALAEMFVKTATSSVIPNVFRQLARGIDPYYRDVYSGDSLGENLLDNAKNSLPGLRETLPVKQDPFGDEKKYGGSTLSNVLNAMVNPAGLNTYSRREVSAEMERIKNETSRVDMYPDKTAPTKIDYDGSSYDMTYKERQQYLRTAGKRTEELYSQFMNSSAYSNLSDDQKADALADLAKASRTEAKMEFLKSRGIVGRGEEANVSSWIKLAENNPRKTAEYFLDSQYLRSADTDGNGNFSNAEKARGLIDGGYSGKKLVEKVREYMTTDNGNCQLGDMLERAQRVKVPDSVTLDVYEFYNNASGKDASGKTVSGLKKKRVQRYIYSLKSLTTEQKNALYYSLYKK